MGARRNLANRSHRLGLGCSEIPDRRLCHRRPPKGREGASDSLRDFLGSMVLSVASLVLPVTFLKRPPRSWVWTGAAFESRSSGPAPELEKPNLRVVPW